MEEYKNLANNFLICPKNEIYAKYWGILKETYNPEYNLMNVEQLEEVRNKNNRKYGGMSCTDLWEVRINELKTMYKLLEDKPKVIVELGVWEGNSTEAWAQVANKVYAIDVFITPKFRKNVLSKYNNIEVIESDSSFAANKFLDESVDMVYIDGSHEYEGVKKDILAWLPKIKINGYLTGHDFLVSTSHDKMSSERVDMWDKNKNNKIIEKNGIKIAARNEPAKAIIDLIGIPDWFDVMNPPITKGANWFFKIK
jgi:hypothetical protein